MKLKEQIKIFDESFNDSSGEPTKTPVDLFAGVADSVPDVTRY